MVLSLDTDPPSLSLTGARTGIEWFVEEMPGEYLVSVEGTDMDASLPPDDLALLYFIELVDRRPAFEARAFLGPLPLSRWWSIGDLPITYGFPSPETRWAWRFGYREERKLIGKDPDSRPGTV